MELFDGEGENMRKAIIPMIIAIVLTLFVSCSIEIGHSHTFDYFAWAYDSEYHWHPATCGHTTEVRDKAPHEFVDGHCIVCYYSPTVKTSGNWAISENGTIWPIVGTLVAKNTTIPTEVQGIAVTSIREYAFRDCTGLTSITIPNSVTSI